MGSIMAERRLRLGLNLGPIDPRSADPARLGVLVGNVRPAVDHQVELAELEHPV
jgi:hypothetical protein